MALNPKARAARVLPNRTDPVRTRPGLPGQRDTRAAGQPSPSLFPLTPSGPQSRAEAAAGRLPPGAAGRSQSATGATPPPRGVPQPRGEVAAAAGGLARLAASSPKTDERRGTEYFLLRVRTLLNRCDSPRVPFEWTVNPYRGCEFACRYCYARYTHEYLELEPEEFERKIYAKADAGRRMACDLDAHFPAQSLSLFDPRTSTLELRSHIAIGTATDPYQPAERRFGATREVLTELARRSGLSLSITTKSDQVVRDLDLLGEIAGRSELSVNITITTLRPRLARLLEPRAPRPDLRLRAVTELSRAGIAVGVFAMPVLPGLTDGEADLDALARAARAAGAGWLGAQALFLMPSSLKVFLPFLEEKFPRLVARYREWYGRGGYAPETYRAELAARVARIRSRHGLASRPYAPRTAIVGALLAAPRHGKNRRASG